MVGLTTDPIDPRLVEQAVAHPGAGAILTFLGVTRNHFEDRPVTGLHYQAYGEMAQPELQRICEEAAARWAGVRVALLHRVGDVSVGEISVVIAVSAPHRDDAYQASRYTIDQLKQRVPIWKQEHYVDGQAWKANLPPDAVASAPSIKDVDGEYGE
ncbi:MAG: molybdenum cofactor biosynthesis protein MoaE [Oligoflexia bacterium]|nr:molybdenum cofactor biosynthesis protein MoaE [Oligoflexia bacterium]